MVVARSTLRFLWLALILACILLYVGLTLGFGLGNPVNFVGGTQLRAFLPVFVLFVVVADLLRLVPVEREEAKVEAEQVEVGKVEVEVEVGKVEVGVGKVEVEKVDAPAPSNTGVGESLFRKSQAIPHQEVPDYDADGLYLDLLGDAAEAGYGPAQAMLGEYALMRGTLVEAYYWMWRAQKSGLLELETVLRRIRTDWVAAGKPEEEGNVYELFSEEAGSIARALLGIDANHNAFAARKFLKENFPSYLHERAEGTSRASSGADGDIPQNKC